MEVRVCLKFMMWKGSLWQNAWEVSVASVRKKGVHEPSHFLWLFMQYVSPYIALCFRSCFRILQFHSFGEKDLSVVAVFSKLLSAAYLLVHLQHSLTDCITLVFEP